MGAAIHEMDALGDTVGEHVQNKAKISQIGSRTAALVEGSDAFFANQGSCPWGEVCCKLTYQEAYTCQKRTCDGPNDHRDDGKCQKNSEQLTGLEARLETSQFNLVKVLQEVQEKLAEKIEKARRWKEDV